MTKQYEGKRVCVLGAGVSGIAAAHLLRAQGAEPWLLDQAVKADLTLPPSLVEERGICLRCGVTALPDEDFALCVTSPGFSRGHPLIQEALRRNIRVAAEMEIGFAAWRGKILAVTGSKGKSSLVKLCADTLSAAGHPAAPCGNFGTPLSTLALTQPELEWAVTEVSSFQLEWMRFFRPHIALLLNIQNDHLDRHASQAEYAALKLSLFARQGRGDTAIIPAGLGYERLLPQEAMIVDFGVSERAMWQYCGGILKTNGVAKARHIAVAGSWFDNEVLGSAAAAAAAALTACGLNEQEIAGGMHNFVPLPYRMQQVVTACGVRFVNDSKATSLAATAAALRMSQEPVRLIAGGRLKERNLDIIKELLTKRVKKVYLIGEAAQSLYDAWSDVTSCKICGDLTVATESAASEAAEGETILLSPGCASFDQFKNYVRRGEEFTVIARKIAEKMANTVGIQRQERIE